MPGTRCEEGWMTTRTGEFALSHAHNICSATAGAAEAARAGRWAAAIGAANSVFKGGWLLRQAAVVDALTAGEDWWGIGEALGLHPQAAYDQFGQAGDGTPHTPAPHQQRPDLAIVVSAGRDDRHRCHDGYGAALARLDPDHSAHHDPTVRRLQAASAEVGIDVWIAVTLPALYTADGIDKNTPAEVLMQWTSVGRNTAEIAYLRRLIAGTSDGSTR